MLSTLEIRHYTQTSTTLTWRINTLIMSGKKRIQKTRTTRHCCSPIGKVLLVLECTGNSSRGVPGNSRFFVKIRTRNGKSYIEIFASKLSFLFWKQGLVAVRPLGLNLKLGWNFLGWGPIDISYIGPIGLLTMTHRLSWAKAHELKHYSLTLYEFEAWIRGGWAPNQIIYFSMSCKNGGKVLA